MADFTREELAKIRSQTEEWVSQGSHSAGVLHETMLRLLSMAERAVSEETVRKLAEFERIADETELEDDHDKDRDAWEAFTEGAADDLRQPADRLAAKGGG